MREGEREERERESEREMREREREIFHSFHSFHLSPDFILFYHTYILSFDVS